MDIALDRINPLHPVRDRAKLAHLTAAMREGGWQGRPLLGELSVVDRSTVRLWTGSHRYAAAKAAGLDDVPVVLIDTDALAAAGFEPALDRDYYGGEWYRNAMTEDSDEILRALRAADPEAADIFALDVE